MTTQPDLFDAERARAARDAAMDQVEANAPLEWKRFVAAIIVEVARTKPEFTTDDVERLRIARRGPSTPENRALGPLMLGAARQGICEKTGRVQNSEQISNHGRPKQIWRSLVYR